MNKAEIIRGIETTMEGLEIIKNALGDVTAEADIKPNKSKSVERREAIQKDEPVNQTVEAVEGNLSVEQLNSMKYNEFKKYASSLGVKCTGTRDEIMERILALNENGGADVEAEVEEVEETETKSNSVSKSKKVGNKKVAEPTTDEFDKQAEEVAKETDIEDIIEALADVGIEANKKNAVSLLAKALREGLIELEDDEDEDEEDVAESTLDEEVDDEEEVEADEVEEDEEDGDEISSTSYFAEYDPKGYNNPDEMSRERAEAIEEKMDEVLTKYSDGELTDDDIASFLEDNATEDEIELLGDEYTEEDLLKMYMEIIKRTIDNDGEEHEPGEPYEVGGYDVCCGRELKYSKKTKKYICEVCGTEYEAE